MAKSVILNPPYNMRWTHPELAGFLPKYSQCIPPESNANYAFILSALEWCDDKAVILLPNGVLSTDNKQEKQIRKMLIEANLLSAVIIIPDSMFVSTNIPTCLLVFDKNKQTASVEMIDMRNEYVTEIRDQSGQYGGESHTKRIYHKEFKVFSDEHMKAALDAISGKQSIDGYCRSVSIQDIRDQDYILTPTRYIEQPQAQVSHRAFAEIANDYNDVVKAKNSIKLTVNETAARRLGIPVDQLKEKQETDVSKAFEVVGCNAEKDDYISFTKSAVIKIEIDTKHGIPYEILDFLKAWKLRERVLNDKQNILLAEFRDALLPALMSGEIDVEEREEQTNAD